jgi:putative zinc finger protein
MSAVDRYTCEEVIRRLNDYLDHEMTLIKEHLDTCAECASAHVYEAGVLQELKRKLRRIDVPQSLANKVAAILSQRPDH